MNKENLIKFFEKGAFYASNKKIKEVKSINRIEKGVVPFLPSLSTVHIVFEDESFLILEEKQISFVNKNECAMKTYPMGNKNLSTFDFREYVDLLRTLIKN